MRTFKQMLAILGLVSLVGVIVPANSLGDIAAPSEIAQGNASALVTKATLTPKDVYYNIFDCWWTYAIDFDGDGYTRGRRLNVDADTNLSNVSVYVKIWYRLMGSSTWLLDSQTETFIITGYSETDATSVWIETVPEYPHGTYEFMVQLYSAANVLLKSKMPSDDSDLNNVKFETGAEDSAPEIDVRGNGISIPDGDTSPSATDGTSYGSTLVGTPIERTFYIHNTGMASLSLNSISVPSGFTITAGSIFPLAPGGNTWFTVQLSATTVGTYSGDIIITSNDANENPYNFRITGTVFTRSPVYRFYSPRYRGHFFTISEDEKNNLIANSSKVWNYEGAAYYAYPAAVSGTVPLYRFWSAKYSGHFFTISESEKNNIIANLSKDWKYEGVAYYVYPVGEAGRSPVYRFWSNRYHHHFFTISESEKNNIIATLSKDWSYEGVAYYAFAPKSRGVSGGSSVPEASEDLTSRNLISAEPSSFRMAPSRVALDGKVDNSGVTGIQRAATSDYGDVVFPMTYLGRDVAANGYDSLTEKWTRILETTNSPSSAVFAGVQPDRSYLFEVFATDPNSGTAVSVHRSSFEMQLDAPAQLNGSAQPTLAEDTVGSPIARIKMPAEDGSLTVKLYSSSKGVVQTLTEVAGGEVVDLNLPEWNRWYWIGGWRDSDNALVLSIWMRHGTEE